MHNLSSAAVKLSPDQHLDTLITWLVTRPNYLTYGMAGELHTLLVELRAARAALAARSESA